MFLNVPSKHGSTTLNLNRIDLIRWGLTPAGVIRCDLYLAGSDEPIPFEGKAAVVLSQAVSTLEARTERDLNADLEPMSLYDDGTDDDLDALQECLVLSGPDDAA